jgi:hypothetical protein
MMVERFPTLKEEVGGSIPGCEILFLPDGKLARLSIVSCALTPACPGFVSKKKLKRERERERERRLRCCHRSEL